MVNIIQCNLNRSPRAFDMLVQNMIEQEASIAMSEPPFVSNNTNWLSSGNNLAAIYWRPRMISALPKLIVRRRHSVTVKFDRINVMACYISPNVDRGSFLEFVDELSDALQTLNGDTLIGGDFNSKSTLWENE